MSVVTNVLVLAGVQMARRDEDLELEKALLRPCPEDGWAPKQALHLISHANWSPDKDRHPHKGGGECWGGSKVPECDVYAAAFNHLDWDQFKTWLESLPWIDRSVVLVLRMRDGDKSFSVWRFFAPSEGGPLLEIVPAKVW